MSEREDLVALHGAIDRQVREQPWLRVEVARYLPAYRDPNAVGWYEDFERWTHRISADAVLPDLDAALEGLSRRAARPRDAARRLLITAVAARVLPQLDGGRDDRLVQILDIDGLVPPGAASDLLDRITGPRFESIEQWAPLLLDGADEGLVTPKLALQAGAPPCWCVMAPVQVDGHTRHAAQIFASFPVRDVSFECACGFLDPSRWETCSDFWCQMTPLSVPVGADPIYHEKVSLDCADENTWHAETYLRFHTIEPDGAKFVSFWLDPDRSSPNDDITVDEGWLAVIHEGDALRVKTLKRVRFRSVVLTAAVGALICALGYADAAADLVFNCAQGCQTDPLQPGTDPPPP